MKQRLRAAFSRGEALKYISHLDLMRLWTRALRRAGLPLAYSQGFSPHPRFSLAAPLAVGVTSDGEMLDFFLERRLRADLVAQRLQECLPEGIVLREIKEVGLVVPSLPSQVRWAEYRVVVAAPQRPAELQAALDAFLKLQQLPWQHARDKEVRRYDLRALVAELRVVAANGSQATLFMRLQNDDRASGRPEQVALALGLAPLALHRTRLVLAFEIRKETIRHG